MNNLERFLKLIFNKKKLFLYFLAMAFKMIKNKDYHMIGNLVDNKIIHKKLLKK